MTSFDIKRIHRRNGRATKGVDIVRVRRGVPQSSDDCLAVEEPLEIRLGYRFLDRPATRSISVTMRTPGGDHVLAAGFLYGEGIIESARDVDRIDHLDDDDEPSDKPTNIVFVGLRDDVDVDVASVQRNFYTTSSCGVCGKGSLEALQIDDCAPLSHPNWTIDSELIADLPDRLRTEQSLFEQTGGIHAAGLFDGTARPVEVREDVGRHNAMDKLVGARLLDDNLSDRPHVAVWSGRASFELMQKALRARIPVVVAVGAPSSLAVDLARHFGITLVGFARRRRFNVYAHPKRIA